MSIAISVLMGTGEEGVICISKGFSIDGANGGEPEEEGINHVGCVGVATEPTGFHCNDSINNEEGSN